MCEVCRPTSFDRRRFLASGLLGVVGALTIGHQRPAGAAVPRGAQVVAPGLAIHPRDEWGADLPPRGPLPAEPDTRLLLVHHTAGSTQHTAEQVPELIRQIYRFHTGPDRGWNDACYNFVIDRYGGVWEARAGSLAGPVMADATGGSQGFAQLVCLIGDFTATTPSPEAVDALVLTLAWLADRHGLDTSSGATTTFTSRGSNRWPAGASVTARIISGHRDMSATACPGDSFYPFVRDQLTAAVAARRASLRTPAATAPPPVVTGATPTSPPATAGSPTTTPPTPSATTAPAATVPTTAPTTAAAQTTTSAAAEEPVGVVAPPSSGSRSGVPLDVVVPGAVAAGLAVAGIGAMVRSRRSPPPGSDEPTG
jgi:hypothetical protein